MRGGDRRCTIVQDVEAGRMGHGPRAVLSGPYVTDAWMMRGITWMGGRCLGLESLRLVRLGVSFMEIKRGDEVRIKCPGCGEEKPPVEPFEDSITISHR